MSKQPSVNRIESTIVNRRLPLAAGSRLRGNSRALPARCRKRLGRARSGGAPRSSIAAPTDAPSEPEVRALPSISAQVTNRPYKHIPRRAAWWFTFPPCWLNSRTRSRKSWPPVKVAIDAEGKYTRAAESFAQKNSARLEDLTRTTTPKGEYLSLRKTTQGRPAHEILPEILPGAILGLSFPQEHVLDGEVWHRALYGPSAGCWPSWEKGSRRPRSISKSWA